ncbi:MAG TPA: TlpA disulfide reductase family protein [Polyangia bacterium]|jgi:peroxiredoxin|nr:TlpA disulfide reductase family protein [Polyangia bacterium]
MKTRNGSTAALALTVLALAYVTTRFLAGAHESLERTRANACRGLNPDPVPVALLNREAPDFELPDASGKLVSLRSQRGHPVLVNFWATWCPPCIEEMPSMEELARTIENTDIRMMAVSVDDGWEPIRRFFTAGTKMGVLLDLSKEVPKKYGTEKYPETYLIDASGKVRHYFINKRDWSKPEALACLESLR